MSNSVYRSLCNYQINICSWNVAVSLNIFVCVCVNASVSPYCKSLQVLKMCSTHFLVLVQVWLGRSPATLPTGACDQKNKQLVPSQHRKKICEMENNNVATTPNTWVSWRLLMNDCKMWNWHGESHTNSRPVSGNKTHKVSYSGVLKCVTQTSRA